MNGARADGYARSRSAAVAVAAVLAATAASAGGHAAAAARPSAGTPAAGTISTVAGGVGGPAKATKVSVHACGTAYASGHVYVADATDSGTGDEAASVRMVNPGTGYLTTVAGTGLGGVLGDGGLATRAQESAYSVATDKAGNLVLADGATNRIRVVAASTGTFYGRAMTSGHIYSVAGNGTQGFAGDGGPATAAKLSQPGAVAVDGAGNLLVADSGNNRVRVVAASTGTFYGQPMTAGDIYTIAGNGTPGFSGDGGPATAAEFYIPQSVAVDPSGNVIIDNVDGRIRKVTG